MKAIASASSIEAEVRSYAKRAGIPEDQHDAYILGYLSGMCAYGSWSSVRWQMTGGTAHWVRTIVFEVNEKLIKRLVPGGTDGN